MSGLSKAGAEQSVQDLARRFDRDEVVLGGGRRGPNRECAAGESSQRGGKPQTDAALGHPNISRPKPRRRVRKTHTPPFSWVAAGPTAIAPIDAKVVSSTGEEVIKPNPPSQMLLVLSKDGVSRLASGHSDALGFISEDELSEMPEECDELFTGRVGDEKHESEPGPGKSSQSTSSLSATSEEASRIDQPGEVVESELVPATTLEEVTAASVAAVGAVIYGSDGDQKQEIPAPFQGVGDRFFPEAVPMHQRQFQVVHNVHVAMEDLILILSGEKAVLIEPLRQLGLETIQYVLSGKVTGGWRKALDAILSARSFSKYVDDIQSFLSLCFSAVIDGSPEIADQKEGGGGSLKFWQKLAVVFLASPSQINLASVDSCSHGCMPRLASRPGKLLCAIMKIKDSSKPDAWKTKLIEALNTWLAGLGKTGLLGGSKKDKYKGARTLAAMAMILKLKSREVSGEGVLSSCFKGSYFGNIPPATQSVLGCIREGRSARRDEGLEEKDAKPSRIVTLLGEAILPSLLRPASGRGKRSDVLAQAFRDVDRTELNELACCYARELFSSLPAGKRNAKGAHKLLNEAMMELYTEVLKTGLRKSSRRPFTLNAEADVVKNALLHMGVALTAHARAVDNFRVSKKIEKSALAYDIHAPSPVEALSLEEAALVVGDFYVEFLFPCVVDAFARECLYLNEADTSSLQGNVKRSLANMVLKRKRIVASAYTKEKKASRR